MKQKLCTPFYENYTDGGVWNLAVIVYIEECRMLIFFKKIYWINKKGITHYHAFDIHTHIYSWCHMLP